MYTPIELDKTRNFRYGMKAIDYIEKKLKKPIGKINLEELTMEQTATIVCGGLVHEDSNLTPSRVMDLIDEKGNLQEVLEAMAKAFGESFSGGEAKNN
ncbi:hypothetical protein [Clostridium sartagoforme]|uniref:hypothetical protein n=1 Tax=Clostridium sartagoforme TaxID=84031 RepID=UPI0031DE6434